MKNNDTIRTQWTNIAVRIGETQTGTGSYEVVDVSAVLLIPDIKGVTDSKGGVVCTTGLRKANDENIESDKIEEYCIVFVLDGQMCSILGRPKYQCIYTDKKNENDQP